MHVMLSVCTKRNFQTDIQIKECFNQLAVILGNMEHSRLLLVTGGRPRTGKTQLQEAILHAIEENPSVITRLRTLLQVNLTCTIRIHALCLQTSGEERGRSVLHYYYY
ncbi:hypothetical protein C0J52_14343 [Blattella germanica]|nr:hypothetical protein C0J52_14343 [Blattella germanica]